MPIDKQGKRCAQPILMLKLQMSLHMAGLPIVLNEYDGFAYPMALVLSRTVALISTAVSRYGLLMNFTKWV